ncbi:serine acetyltransferase [Psychroflexus sp. MES1-P1E]|uniref:serine acetyltransferase n=1 Tax=Psychroflexus sp. MES1-P1E TaxID=2058320 RepID=UPI000C7A8DEE|nr:serine acetyltransferase [Psychroflexus sp. MES1-P1E]PKG43426.1 serine acetyltransferase [Psychroflexus sp. MES1-P1E]
MIKSKKDYLHYLEADRIALGKPTCSLFVIIKEKIKREHIWEFQRLLRKTEYYKNVGSKNIFLGKLLYVFLKIKFKNLSLKLGFSIPENVFGPGLAILHYGTIIVNQEAKVGANCRLQACTNIGQSGGKAGAPTIGDNVYIGPGAKIYGEINIPNNCAIAANAAVSKSFFTENIVIGGVPAKEIGKIEIQQLIKHL